jgi:hypothetical protein
MAQNCTSAWDDMLWPVLKIDSKTFLFFGHAVCCGKYATKLKWYLEKKLDGVFRQMIENNGVLEQFFQKNVLGSWVVSP